MAVIAYQYRGDLVDQIHRGHIAVTDHTGKILWKLGDPERLTFARSSAKPLQAIPVAESGALEHYGITPQELAVRALDRHGLTPYFRFVVGTKEERRGKDDPVFFELTASRLGVTAAECTVFEDALYAMQGAKKAGCRVIGVEDGTNLADREEMIRLCDRVIADYAEL